MLKEIKINEKLSLHYCSSVRGRFPHIDGVVTIFYDENKKSIAHYTKNDGFYIKEQEISTKGQLRINRKLKNYTFKAI